MAKNRCQYWNLYEAHQCVHWSTDSNSCTYVEEKTDDLVSSLSAESTDKETKEVTVAINAIVQPTYYPSCNYIGTAVLCSNYESSAPGQVLPRCILPDPTRHVCNRWTGEKWVSISTTESVDEYGETVSTTAPDFSPINGYNSGGCNGNGTDTTCSGYSPQHMGFGRLIPSSDESLDSKGDAYKYAKLSEFSIRLPLHYVLFNLRSKLSKCMFWSGDYLPFTVNSGTSMVELAGSWLCSNTNDTSTYNDFNITSGAPCNGCKPECPYYSGVCWEYCIDSLVKTGDPILAEQVHELRYYCRENTWTISAINDYFLDQGYIYTWEGAHKIAEDGAAELKGSVSYTINATNNTIEEYQIPSVKTYMTEFDYFQVNHDNLVLTKGTEVDGDLPTFPTLISEFSTIQLAPIIKNRFDIDGVFETTMFGETTLLLYGKIFIPGEVFVLNIRHTDIVSSIPKELFEYDSLLDIKLAKGNTAYSNFYNTYEHTIDLLKKLVVTGKYVNKLSDEENTTFLVEAPIYPVSELYGGINTLVVFQNSSEGLLFSKIDVSKNLVGGALIQTKFSIQGDNIPVKQPVDYTKGLNAQINKNGTLAFKFFPFIGVIYKSSLSYYYDDSNIGAEMGTLTESEVTHYRGYKTYEICAKEYFLSSGSSTEGDLCEYYFLGDDGYLLIKINNLELNRVFKPWEFKKIEARYEDGTVCEFEKVYSGADSTFLEVNQIIVKPKNKADFKSICGGVPIFIEDLKYYKRLSFDELPTVPDMWEYVVEGGDEDPSVNTNKIVYDVSVKDNVVNISNFQFIMTPTAVIANAAGRPFSIFRTKPLGWLKQNTCPAVEIYYSWSASYTEWTNTPVCRCCGEWSETNAMATGRSFSPPCGDHDVSRFFGCGPVWWPFTACESYATYNIISNLDNYSIDVIGLFKTTSEDGNKIHGDHDMRMLGPSNHTAFHDRGCNFLIPCSCNWRTYNLDKVGDNVFNGFGRVRSGVDSGQLNIWKEDGNTLPKFGNAVRPKLDSYRTLGKEQYLKTDDGGATWTVDWRVMPAFMAFNTVDFLDCSDSGMWDYGASTIGGAPPVQNPLGFLLADSFEGESINEQIDYKNRFYLDEFCNVSICVDTIRYPKTIGKYAFSKAKGKIYPWFEFKAYNPPQTADSLASGGGSSDSTVQWAWQEKWKALERLTSEGKSKADFIRGYLAASVTNGNTYMQDAETDEVFGMFSFLDINYPNYLYNYKLKEFTTTVVEGYTYIEFIAPERDESTGEYTGYIGLSLGGGPVRGISWKDGTWLTNENVTESIDFSEYNLDLYKKCAGLGGMEIIAEAEVTWFDEVTLFDAGCLVTNDNISSALTLAEGNEQMVESYGVDDEEKEIVKKLCYQRGLNVTINSETFSSSNLPTQQILTDYFEGIIDAAAPTEKINTAICGTTSTAVLSVNFDNKVKTISAIDMTYNYGAEVVDVSSEVGKAKVYKYYHIPAIAVYTSEDGVTKKDLLFEKTSMVLYLDSTADMTTETFNYPWENTFDYLFSGSLYIIVDLRITPTADELAALSEDELKAFSKSISLVQYSIFGVYEELLTGAKEYINTWERKYYVSYGNSGDSPPQGKSPEENPTLFIRSFEKSTPYIKESSSGVTNMEGSDKDGFTITSKIGGGILHLLYEDESRLDGDVYELEGMQKKIFDESIKINVENATMRSVVPPSLKGILASEGMRFLDSTDVATFENTLLTKLAEINSFQPMSGEGHKYIPSGYYEANCRGWCGDKEDAVFEYVFTPLDEEAEGAYTGQNYLSALDTFYTGTYNYLQRLDFANIVIENVFNKKYGGSSATKIWVSDEESTLLFYTLEPLMDTFTVGGFSGSYNLNYLALSMNWHNAYFNTAENSGMSLVN